MRMLHLALISLLLLVGFALVVSVFSGEDARAACEEIAGSLCTQEMVCPEGFAPSPSNACFSAEWRCCLPV